MLKFIFACTALLTVSLPTPVVAQDTVKGELPTQLRAALQNHGLDGRGLSIEVRELGSQQSVLSWQADTPRNPASTIKLFTTFAALEQLSPGFQWATEVHVEGVIRSGRLAGNLWLKGGGDSFLPLERMWLLVQHLRETGLQRIDGDLLIDQSFFELPAEDSSAFDGQGLRAYNVAPEALISNFNAIRYVFRPIANSDRVSVSTIPDLGLPIENRLRSVNGACRGYNRGINLRLGKSSNVIVSGKFPKQCDSYSLTRSTVSADRYTAELFRRLWRESGGKWDGTFRRGQLDQTSDALLTFPSLPLGEMVRSINKYSNNLMTRTLWLALGAEQYGAPATPRKAKVALEKWLSDNKLSRSGLIIDNGAGRSRKTRASARHFTGLLEHAWRSPYMPEMLASLAVSGQDGTLARRKLSTELDGQAHLKTGRLDHVVALAGFLQAADGRRYTIVSLHNAKDVHRGSGHAVQAALLEWVYKL